MGLLNRFFGRQKYDAAPLSEHAVIVHFHYGSTDLSRIFALEQEIEEAIAAAGVGEFDGNEVAADGSDGSLYMYGPDADRLFEAIRPVLASATCISEVVAPVRYGPPADGTREREVSFGS